MDRHQSNNNISVAHVLISIRRMDAKGLSGIFTPYNIIQQRNQIICNRDNFTVDTLMFLFAVHYFKSKLEHLAADISVKKATVNSNKFYLCKWNSKQSYTRPGPRFVMN